MLPVLILLSLAVFIILKRRSSTGVAPSAVVVDPQLAHWQAPLQNALKTEIRSLRMAQLPNSVINRIKDRMGSGNEVIEINNNRFIIKPARDESKGRKEIRVGRLLRKFRAPGVTPAYFSFKADTIDRSIQDMIHIAVPFKTYAIDLKTLQNLNSGEELRRLGITPNVVLRGLWTILNLQYWWSPDKPTEERPLLLSHGDFHCGNVIYDTKTQEFSVIDFSNAQYIARLNERENEVSEKAPETEDLEKVLRVFSKMACWLTVNNSAFHKAVKDIITVFKKEGPENAREIAENLLELRCLNLFGPHLYVVGTEHA